MKTGQKLPELKYWIKEKKFLTTTDLVGKKIIIYFYPKDDTPGCTKEAIQFNSFLKKFQNLDTEIFGISKDNLVKHKKFKLKYKIKFDLISDIDNTICQKFGVWVEKSMYGKKYMGIERSTFFFDANLKLIKTWKNVKVKGHVEEVFDFISNST